MAMKQKDILELMTSFEGSALTRFEYKDTESSLLMEKCGVVSEVQAKEVKADTRAEERELSSKAAEYSETDHKIDEESSRLVQITSPIVGVYYAAPSPEAEPYVKLGDKVSAGQTVCLVEAMKMMNELKASTDGIIKSINAVNGELVEFNQVIFEVERC